MNKQKIEEEIKYLESKIDKDFEEHFSKLVLEDFYEGGYNDRIEDLIFYEEYFERYETDVINLLLKIQDEFSDEFQNYKLRLIKLKRIIDNKLFKVESNDIEESNKRKIRRTNQFLFEPNIDREKFLKTLYNELINNTLIDVSENEFKQHFNNDWGIRIKWLGTEIQITNLFSLFISKKILNAETLNFKYKLISSHFVNKKGNLFNEKQLGSVYSDKKEMIAKDDIIFSIIEKVSTHL